MLRLDGPEFEIPQYSEVCTFCAHYRPRDEERRRCDAFPDGDGIPLEIWKGKNDHTAPHPGDNGIVFERGAPHGLTHVEESSNG
jgi:hypothetical protein